MRKDPLEMKMGRPTPKRRAVVTQPANETPDDATSAPQVVDEAFAALASQVARVDRSNVPQENKDQPPAQQKTPSELVSQHRTLVAEMVTQLEALDRQRDKLAKLLDGIDATGTTDSLPSV